MQYNTKKGASTDFLTTQPKYLQLQCIYMTVYLFSSCYVCSLLISMFPNTFLVSLYESLSSLSIFISLILSVSLLYLPIFLNVCLSVFLFFCLSRPRNSGSSSHVSFLYLSFWKSGSSVYLYSFCNFCLVPIFVFHSFFSVFLSVSYIYYCACPFFFSLLLSISLSFCLSRSIFVSLGLILSLFVFFCPFVLFHPMCSIVCLSIFVCWLFSLHMSLLSLIVLYMFTYVCFSFGFLLCLLVSVSVW